MPGVPFQIPLHFEDLLRSSAEEWRVTQQNNIRTDDLLVVANSDVDSIFVSTAPPSEAFIGLYNVIHRYGKSTQALRKSIIKAMVSLSSRADASNADHVKVASFFLCGLVTLAEGLTTRCKHWDKTGRESALEALLALVTQISTPSRFGPAVTDKIAGLLQRVTLSVLSSSVAARDKTTRNLVARLLACALKLDAGQSVAATSALIHALFRQEHLAVPVAEVVHILADECNLVQFCNDFVREIASLDTEALARDALGAKNFATVISIIAEHNHEIVKSNITGLLAHLDGASYMMRNGVIHVLGVLIARVPKADDPLLRILMERAERDVNAFTRSKTLQTWAVLAQEKCVPIKLFPKVCAVAAGRLDDKGSVVRKAAAQLLGTLLTTNPFGPALKLSHFEARLAEEQKLAEEREQAVQEEMVQQEDEEEEIEVELDAVDEAGKEMEDEQPVKEKEEERKLKYYSSAVAFIKAIEEGLSKVYGMLRSKSITDVNEGVNFLVTAIQFQLDAASGKAVRAMLPLALAREVNIRTVAVKAYATLLNPAGEGVEEKESAMAVTNGLVALAAGATTGEVACLEALIGALSKTTKDIPMIITEAVVTVTWDLFAGKVPGSTMEQRNAACMLVGMFASSYPATLLSRVSVLEEVGLDQTGFRQWACVALCRLPQGCDTDMRISRRLIELCKSTTDLAVIDRAVTAIYRLHPAPESDITELVCDLASIIKDYGSAVPVDELSRFLVLIGQVAVKQLVRVELLVKAAKRQKARDADNEDLERAAAEADNMNLHAEKELVAPGSLLGRWGDMAARISANEQAPSKLRASAVLCMTKLMCIQADYCDRNLQLLFTILERAPHAHIRSNAVTALGDLAYRFPNNVEPWSSRIYAALRDDHRQVRTNTLMALTHLILNDQVKVKGQIVEIAICLLDEDERIADLARIFFHELARKDKNSIYNILPDTISCLGRKVGSAEFKTVIGFLIGLLDKDKHHEGMIDKLCHRFRAADGVQETRDLAYCIALLNVTENGLKKLNDKFKSYAPALVDDTVYKSFTSILVKGRKNCTSQSAVQVIDEVTSKIEGQRKADDDDAPTPSPDVEDAHMRTDDDESEVSTSSRRRTRRSTAAATTTPQRTRRKKPQTKKESQQQRRKPNTRRRTSKKMVIESDSESEDESVDLSSDEDEEDDDTEMGED